MQSEQKTKLKYLATDGVQCKYNLYGTLQTLLRLLRTHTYLFEHSSASPKLRHHWHCISMYYSLQTVHTALVLFRSLVAIIYICIWIRGEDRDKWKRHVLASETGGVRKGSCIAHDKCIHLCGVYTQCPLLQRNFQMQLQKLFCFSTVSLSVRFGYGLARSFTL